MNKLISYILILLSFASATLADTITLGTSDAPPYMIKKDNSGIDIEITKTVLERMGHKVKVKYFSLARAQKELEDGRIDAMVPLFSSAQSSSIHVSQPHVMYRPTAFTLKGRNLQLNVLSDLGKYKLMTFQGATGYFGEVFKEATQVSPHYKEFYDMTKLVKLLYRKHTDVVVLDYNIFHYYLRDINFTRKYEMLKAHSIFPKVPAVVGFHNKQLRDQFNTELSKLYKDGSQKKIVQKYIK